MSVLADQVNGDPIRYADAVVVARNGRIYFSDASGRFAPADWGGTFEAAVLDIIEQRATGRILEYDPATQRTRVVVRGLSFPNGVALSADEKHLYVAETGRYRIWKVAVDAADLDAGSGSPQATVLFDNLPGYPDNLMRGDEGRIWVGMSGPRSAAVDDMAGKPLLRALTLRLPRALWPLPKPYGHVFAFDDSGRIVADLQDPAGSYPADHRRHRNGRAAVHPEPAPRRAGLEAALSAADGPALAALGRQVLRHQAGHVLVDQRPERVAAQPRQRAQRQA